MVTTRADCIVLYYIVLFCLGWGRVATCFDWMSGGLKLEVKGGRLCVKGKGGKGLYKGIQEGGGGDRIGGGEGGRDGV